MTIAPSIFGDRSRAGATNMAASTRSTATTAAPHGTDAAGVGQPAATTGRTMTPVAPAPVTDGKNIRSAVVPPPAPAVTPAPVVPPVAVAPQVPNQTPSVAAPVVAAPVVAPTPTADTPPPADTAAADQAVTEAAEKARLKVVADNAKKEEEAKIAAKVT